MDNKLQSEEFLTLQKEQKEKYKAQQKIFRQQQYQKLKKKVKEQKTKATKENFPENVEAAIQFFFVNGFSFSSPIDQAEVSYAWKSLAQVFHPDKGGTHTEALLLNKHYEILKTWVTR
jgi:hypothetical protein